MFDSKIEKNEKKKNDIWKILDQVQLSFHIMQGVRQEVLFKKKFDNIVSKS